MNSILQKAGDTLEDARKSLIQFLSEAKNPFPVSSKSLPQRKWKKQGSVMSTQEVRDVYPIHRESALKLVLKWLEQDGVEEVHVGKLTRLADPLALYIATGEHPPAPSEES